MNTPIHHPIAENTEEPPVVKWMRGTSGTISVGCARVKGEAMVELLLRDAGGRVVPHLLTPGDAMVLAERLADAAQVPEADIRGTGGADHV